MGVVRIRFFEFMNRTEKQKVNIFCHIQFMVSMAPIAQFVGHWRTHWRHVWKIVDLKMLQFKLKVRPIISKFQIIFCHRNRFEERTKTISLFTVTIGTIHEWKFFDSRICIRSRASNNSFDALWSPIFPHIWKSFSTNILRCWRMK